MCPSPSCNAPSLFWPTMAKPLRVGASWYGSPTSGFPSGRAAAPPSGRRDKPSSVQMAPRSPSGSRCKSTPWATPSGQQRTSRGLSRRPAPGDAATSTPPSAAWPSTSTRQAMSRVVYRLAPAVIHCSPRASAARRRPTAGVGGHGHETGPDTRCAFQPRGPAGGTSVLFRAGGRTGPRRSAKTDKAGVAPDHGNLLR